MGRYLFLHMSEDKLFLIMMVENSNKDNADKKIGVCKPSKGYPSYRFRSVIFVVNTADSLLTLISEMS